MNLSLSDTEVEVRDLFANFFATESPLSVVRSSEPLGFDAELWAKLWQTGAPTMGVPESFGGGGASSMALTVVAQEFGRNLSPVPLVEHLAAARALSRAGRGDLLGLLTDETMIATLALTPMRERTARLLPAGAVAGVALVWDGDELVALRRTSDSPVSGVSPKNFGCSPIADWSLESTEFERIVIAQGEHGRSIYSDAVSMLAIAHRGGTQRSGSAGPRHRSRLR